MDAPSSPYTLTDADRDDVLAELDEHWGGDARVAAFVAEVRAWRAAEPVAWGVLGSRDNLIGACEGPSAPGEWRNRDYDIVPLYRRP